MFRYSIGLLFSENERKVALIRKMRPRWQLNKLNAPGGNIKEGETPKEAMIREFKEETGVHIDSWREFCVLSGSDWHLFVFVAFSDELFKVETQEAEPVSIFSVNKLGEEALVDNLRWLIPMALDKNNVHAQVVEQTNF